MHACIHALHLYLRRTRELIQENLHMLKKEQQLYKFKHVWKVLTRNWQSLTTPRTQVGHAAVNLRLNVIELERIVTDRVFDWRWARNGNSLHKFPMPIMILIFSYAKSMDYPVCLSSIDTSFSLPLSLKR